MREFDDHIINAYVRGDLADELSDQLERVAMKDANLRSRIELERLVIAGVEAYGAQRMKKHVGLVIGRYRKRRKRLRWLFMALVLLGLVALYYIMSTSGAETRSKTNQELYAAYYEVPVLHSTSRSEQTSADSSLMLHDAYNARDYKKVRQIGALLDPQGMDSRYSLMLAIAYMEGEEWLEALNAIDDIQAANEYTKETIEWYRCLLFIRLGRIDDARNILPYLAEDLGHEYNRQATELLRELR